MTAASALTFNGMESLFDECSAHFLSKNSTTVPRSEPMIQVLHAVAKEQIAETKIDNVVQVAKKPRTFLNMPGHYPKERPIICHVSIETHDDRM